MKFFVLLCAVCLLASQPVYAGNSQPLHPVDGNPVAPPFKLKGSNGDWYTLEDYRGRVVIVNFWATWCPPCRYELPSMERAYTELKKHNIEILAINVGENEDTIFTFTADYPVTFPLLMDRDSAVIDRYPVVGLPTTFVIDSKGHLVYRAIGTREWDDPGLLTTIKALQKP